MDITQLFSFITNISTVGCHTYMVMKSINNSYIKMQLVQNYNYTYQSSHTHFHKKHPKIQHFHVKIFFMTNLPKNPQKEYNYDRQKKLLNSTFKYILVLKITSHTKMEKDHNTNRLPKYIKGFYMFKWIYWKPAIVMKMISMAFYKKKKKAIIFLWEREMFYLMTHSTHFFIYGYMVSDHSDSEKGNLPYRLLLSINSKGSFICIIPQTG